MFGVASLDTMINTKRGTIMNTDVHLDLFYDPELKWLTGRV